MNSTSLSVALPSPAITLGIEDVGWEQWMEKGRAHDQLMRDRWLQVATFGAVAVLLTSAAILGLA